MKGFFKKLFYMPLNPQSKLETCVAVLKKQQTKTLNKTTTTTTTKIST